MNCFSALFFLFKHAQIETDTVSPTQYFVDIKRPWRILQKKKKTWTKYSRTYLRTMRFNSRIRLFLCYWHVWENRENARTAKGQATSLSLYLSLLISLPLCVFLGPA